MVRNVTKPAYLELSGMAVGFLHFYHVHVKLIVLAITLTIFKLYTFIIRLISFMNGLQFESKTMTPYAFHYIW